MNNIQNTVLFPQTEISVHQPFETGSLVFLTTDLSTLRQMLHTTRYKCTPNSIVVQPSINFGQVTAVQEIKLEMNNKSQLAHKSQLGAKGADGNR